MQTPEINLSPIERRMLDAIVKGLTGEVMLDWVAFRRLIAFGYIEETDTGLIQATAEGKRALVTKQGS
jgi:hypothetical protein